MNYDYNLSIGIVQYIISINIIIYVGMIIFSKLNIDTFLSLYNPFDPFFNFFQFISYMFIHSIHIFLHITFNMFILWIWGTHINSILGHLKFIIIYFYSGITAGLLQNMLKIFIIYYYTGIFDLYKISHVSMYISNIQRINLQYSMYSPIIGSSGAIASIVSVGSSAIINILLPSKIFIINFINYNVLAILNLFPGISHLSHFSGAIAGYYIYLISQKVRAASSKQ